MNLQECYKKIDNYLSKENEYSPRLVDIKNTNLLKELIQHYNVGTYDFVSLSEYCNGDNMPDFIRLINDLSKMKHKTFLVDLTSYLNFLSEDRIKQYLLDLMSDTYNKQLVIVGYQLGKYFFKHQDPRLKNRIFSVDGKNDKIPTIILIDDDKYLKHKKYNVCSMQEIPKYMERADIKNQIYLKTKISSKDFIKCVYNVKEQNNIFNVISEIVDVKLDDTWGTEEQWQYLYNELLKFKTFKIIINKKFDNVEHLENAIYKFHTFSKLEQWLYFIALKVYQAKNNWCLSQAVVMSGDITQFKRNIYCCLIDNVLHTESDYWEKYKQWKELRKLFNDSAEISYYCKYVLSKGKDAIYYLTDITQREKEMIFEQLDKYKDMYINNGNMYSDIKNLMSNIYPDIADYLCTYNFNNKIFDFNKYFNEYKYQKILNTIFPDFEDVVLEQAEKRIYNACLPLRTEKTELIDKQDSHLYFFDALGVEYLGFIMQKCNEKNLVAKVSVCRANLPTITSANKEFIDDFTPLNIPVDNIKDLDDIKHKEKGNFDYQKTKLPIHLIKELECINSLLENIRSKLESKEYSKAIIISDHGASRLAVIKENNLNIEVNSKGTHSGRMCEYNNNLENIQNATIENGYYVLADYSRFKGGRPASVEVHGGATLEEVMVPIIEITPCSQMVHIKLLTPDIVIKRKQVPCIKIFITNKVENLTISLDNKIYNAIETNEDNIYQVNLPDLNKSGKYNFDVYINNNLIETNIVFNAKKEGMQQNDLF